MSWLSRLFKRKQPMNTPIKKIAIIIGHGAGDSGAIGWNNVEEFAYNSEVAKHLLESVHGKELKAFFRTKSGINGVGKLVSEWCPDLSIELHLNAFNGVANGCEVLCLKGDEESAKIGRSFASSFTKIFGRRLRQEEGIKFLVGGDRGKQCLSSIDSNIKRILVEPFYIDNKDEWVSLVEYASFLASWIEGI
jgi:N-acetylmuramoyl-L-alanine amidase